MATPRSHSASISIPGGILVTGGFDGSKVLNTSEMVFLNGIVKEAKPLPEPKWGHCLVEHKGQIISTGGSDGNGRMTSTVWLFNNREVFALTIGPKIRYPRFNHGCAIFNSDGHDGRPELVVAGSGSDDDGRRQTEVWDFTLPGSQWQNFSKSDFLDLHRSVMEGYRIV